jgi:hypothetical protein
MPGLPLYRDFFVQRLLSHARKTSAGARGLGPGAASLLDCALLSFGGALLLRAFPPVLAWGVGLYALPTCSIKQARAPEVEMEHFAG